MMMRKGQAYKIGLKVENMEQVKEIKKGERGKMKNMEKLEDIKRIVSVLNSADYKDLFIALCLNEKIDYRHEIEDITIHDIEFLNNLYNDFMENDSITSFINSEILNQLEKGEK